MMMKVSATDYLLQNVHKHLRKRYKSQFFCVCDSCGSINWIDYQNVLGVTEMIINELKDNGEVLLPRRLIDFLLEKKKNKVNLMCSNCEKELEPILFCDVNKSMRVKVYNMEEKERKNFADGYNISEKLRRENDFKEDKKKKK